jgi:hypothetical protein
LSTDFEKKIIFSEIRKKLTRQEKGPELQKIIFLLGREEILKRFL